VGVKDGGTGDVRRYLKEREDVQIEEEKEKKIRKKKKYMEKGKDVGSEVAKSCQDGREMGGKMGLTGQCP